MEDKRKNLRRHIKAAGEWLKQADKSIEREDDVQGDLKLMLAKAELQNAEKHQNRTYFTKFLSLITAASIAICIFYFNNDRSTEISKAALPQMSIDTPLKNEINKSEVDSTEKLSLIAPTPSNEPEKLSLNESNDNPAQLINEEAPPSLIIESDVDVTSRSLEQDKSKYETSPQPSKYDEEYEPVASTYYQPEPIVASVEISAESNNTSLPTETNYLPEAGTPSQDMQKLMQSAGQILRAE